MNQAMLSQTVNTVCTWCEPKKMDSQKVQQILVETEAAAQQVLVTNEEIVAVDYRRQKTREARRALQSERCEDKAWISLGNIFVKMRTEKAINLLEKGEK